MTIFSRLMGRFGAGRSAGQTATTADVPTLAPFDGPVYVVGDVHGCLSLYLDAEARILEDARQLQRSPTIVLLGDVVDRGPQSAAMIDHLLRPLPKPARRFCLTGNHEAMMLAFMEAPRANLRWLEFGGHETLLSYGITLDLPTLSSMPERKVTQILAAHVPEAHVAFLRATVPALRVGPYLLAHAGADPRASLSAQPLRSLVWGNTGLEAPAGLILIHGHYISAEPDLRPGSIGIDTGAYATGRLTTLRLLKDQFPAVRTTGEGALFKSLAFSD